MSESKQPDPNPLALVTPDLRRVERWWRRRRLLKALITTLILSFGWIGVLVALQKASSKDYSFRAETQLILEQMRDGKFQEVYREASPLFQESMITDRFIELGSDLNLSLGAFRSILALRQVESLKTPGGRTVRVQATVEFENGKTSASFSFHWIDNKWRLLGFSVSIPDELKEVIVARPETRAARVEAPKEVYDLAERVLELVREDNSGLVYDEASSPFQQSIDRQTFLDLQANRRRALGKYVRILDTLKSWISLSRIYAELVMVVQYERARATVTMEFIRVDDGWKLSHYKVVMPRPRIPVPEVAPPAED